MRVSLRFVSFKDALPPIHRQIVILKVQKDTRNFRIINWIPSQLWYESVKFKFDDHWYWSFIPRELHNG